MSREYIAKSLKRLREAQGLTADEVGVQVGKSGKTVNAWENNRGQPDAEILMRLGDIYQVDDILAEFHQIPRESRKHQFQYTKAEQNLIKQHRALDEHGKILVETILSLEYNRVVPKTKIQEIKKVLPTVARNKNTPEKALQYRKDFDLNDIEDESDGNF